MINLRGTGQPTSGAMLSCNRRASHLEDYHKRIVRMDFDLQWFRRQQTQYFGLEAHKVSRVNALRLGVQDTLILTVEREAVNRLMIGSCQFLRGRSQAGKGPFHRPNTYATVTSPCEELPTVFVQHG